MDRISPVSQMVFGFLCLFGFFLVRFFVFVRVHVRSVCSVDFVEKLWENLRKTLWESRGKVSTSLQVAGFYTFLNRILHKISAGGGKFSEGFYTRSDPWKMESFAHFPHSLLL